jgi:AcrR family transcriptional regulator
VRSRSADNRTALLDAARTGVAERGIEATTARDIATRANTSLGAISYHFGTTRALINEALAQAMLEAVEAIASRRLPVELLLEDAVRDPSDHQVRDHYGSLRHAISRATEPALGQLDAMLVAALIDGIALHALIDDEVTAALAELASRAAWLVRP